MKRPEIICHMVTSLDGRLLTERWPFSEEALMSVYEDTGNRLNAKAWAVGRATMLHFMEEGEPRLAPEPAQRPDRIVQPAAKGIGICFDRLGRLRPTSGEIEGDHLVCVVSEKVSDAHVDELEACGVSVVFSGPDGGDIAGAFSRIGEAFSLNRILLEGGGEMNGACLDADLIDEMSTLVLPVVDGAGSGVPSIYEGGDDGSVRELSLISSDTLADGIVWLRHRVLGH